ncbi:hypothetical protein [Polynucleobacter sp. JS-Polo-80-F4]|uniref:hypothetical protein n=1 Tax=Polynucleobacter sp. JS-Polo-80-F4 TaxID=2576918 RepID=UPI001C0C6A8E|nr:hypothetical protein [Polynucleobacter sp. JS-Polo-80-F4]MBU3617281.1 hypothetical protein [Polynucleobacter sp. JS-Polo-80-F4]
MRVSGLRSLCGLALLLLLASCGSPRKPIDYIDGVYATKVDPQLAYKAGQCQAITEGSVNAMKRLSLEGKRYAHYCKNCISTEVSGPFRIERVVYQPVTNISWFFKFNSGAGLDAANIYIETSPGHFYNLSKLIGCPATNISTELVLKP